MRELEERLRTALTDRYALERELGRGGMAVVFLARDPRHDRAVAIKVLRDEIAAALGAERFLREIQIAAKLHHPHILPLYDSGAAGDLLYFVMPCVEGESLRQRLDRETQLPLEDALAITRQVASALAYAHSHDVVHRDIKPENILLEAGEAVVADFGIARAITAAGGDKLTQTGMAIGTPLYMSPEQGAGGGAIDGRSDLYSLACVLYEMLAGHPPFLGGTAQAILARHALDPVPPLRTARGTVSGAVEQALARALAKSPADRYATVLQFAEALAGTTRVTPPRSGGSRRVRAALGVGLALAALGAGLALGRPWRHAPQAAAGGSGYAASVAVLPFETIGGGREDEYFSDGMTDEIITQLAQIRDLKVISRTSVVALKGSHLTLSQIADTLGVDHVLEGSARRAGGRVRVNAQLIAAKTDAHLWAKTYERDLKDVFRVQEEVAADVSRALLASVQGLRPLGAGSRTERPKAYDAYLRGTYWRQLRTRDGLLRAMRAFEEALAIDSAYAPACAGLSSALSLFINFQHPAGPEPVPALARAIVLADRAIALDPGLAEGFTARGFAFINGAAVSSDAALRDLARAVALRPNSGEAHAFTANALSDAGRNEDALAEAQTATDLDPLAPGFHIGFSSAALGARRYDVALREARRAAIMVTAPIRIRNEGLALLLLGRPGDCLAIDLGDQQYLRAMCLEALGRHREAAAIVDSLAALVRDGRASWPVPEGLGMYYAWLGDVDGSLHWYEAATRVVRPGLVRSGVFDRVRNDARFRAGIERLTERNRARLAQAIVQARARRP